MNHTYWNVRGSSGRGYWEEDHPPYAEATGSFHVGSRRFKIRSVEDLAIMVDKSKQLLNTSTEYDKWVKDFLMQKEWTWYFHHFFDIPTEEFFLDNLSKEQVFPKQKEIKGIIEKCLSKEAVAFLDSNERENRHLPVQPDETPNIIKFAHSFKIKDRIRKWVRGKSKHKTVEDLVNALKVLHLEAIMEK